MSGVWLLLNWLVWINFVIQTYQFFVRFSDIFPVYDLTFEVPGIVQLFFQFDIGAVSDAEGPVELDLRVVRPQPFQFDRASIQVVEDDGIVQFGEDLGDIPKISPVLRAINRTRSFFWTVRPNTTRGRSAPMAFILVFIISSINIVLSP